MTSSGAGKSVSSVNSGIPVRLWNMRIRNARSLPLVHSPNICCLSLRLPRISSSSRIPFFAAGFVAGLRDHGDPDNVLLRM